MQKSFEPQEQPALVLEQIPILKEVNSFLYYYIRFCEKSN